MKVNRFLIGSRFVVTSLFCVLPVDTFVDNKEDKRADIPKMSERYAPPPLQGRASSEGSRRKSLWVRGFLRHWKWQRHGRQ